LVSAVKELPAEAFPQNPIESLSIVLIEAEEAVLRVGLVSVLRKAYDEPDKVFSYETGFERHPHFPSVAWN
jgi:hypothetical protein